jgi:hypothetical protein
MLNAVAGPPSGGLAPPTTFHVGISSSITVDGTELRAVYLA